MRTILAIILIVCSVSLAGWNDGLATDPNLTAWYKFDSAVTDASGNGNNLTDVTTDDDTTNKMQGTASRGFESAAPDYLYLSLLSETGCSTNLPGYSTNTDDQFTICAWIRASGTNPWPTSTSTHTIVGKWTTSHLGWRTGVYPGASTAVARLGIATGASTAEYLNHATELHTGDWYHLSFTFNDANHTGTIRIVDANQAHVGSDATKADFSAWHRDTARLDVGGSEAYGPACWQGNLDEVLIFNKALTTTQTDQIAAGTYGAAAPATGGYGALIDEED